jgi:hypothetical protein
MMEGCQSTDIGGKEPFHASGLLSLGNAETRVRKSVSDDAK